MRIGRVRCGRSAVGRLDIDVHGGIVAVSTESALGEPSESVTRVGGLMPALVNANGQGPMTLLRSAGDGMPLMPWLTEVMWPLEAKMTEGDVTVGATLAMCDQHQSSVVTRTERYLFKQSIVDAAAPTGARVQVTAGLILVVVPDDDVLTVRLDAIDELGLLNQDPDSCVTVGYGAHLVQELGLERLARIAERAALLDMVVCIHREETQSEPADVIATHGQSATELVARGTSHDLGAMTASQAFAMLGNDGTHLDRCLTGGQDAELVALGVGQDHPGGIALPNVNARGSYPD